MALTVLLKGTTLGADTGPFKVYHTSIDPLNQVGSPSYTRNQLLGGITITDVPNNAPSLFIQSEGACTNFTEVAIVLPSPSPIPSITPTRTPSRTPSKTPSISASVGATPPVTPSISVSVTVTPTPTVTRSITPTATVTPSPSRSPGASPPETPSVTPTLTPSVSVSTSPSVTPTQSPTPSTTPTQSPTMTPSRTVTPSPTMQMGKCHSFEIPSEDLISGGNNLYIGYTPWGTETVLWTVYSSMVQINDGDPSVWRSVVCGNRYSLVEFKYGTAGKVFTDSTWVTTACNNCCSSDTPCLNPSVSPTPTPTPTPSKSPLVISNWIVRNLDCSGGTVNTTTINKSSLTLAGPSTFPLSSTLYGTQTTPYGVIYGGSNTIQVGVTTNLPGTGNCGVLEVKVNGTIKASKYFTTDPFPSVTGVVINGGDSVEVVIRCMTGPCPPSPSPTPSNTPTPSVSPVVYVVNVEYGPDAQLLCSQGGIQATIYSPDANYLSDGARYYYDAGFSIPMSDMSNFYKDQFGDYGTFNTNGVYTSSGLCN